VKLLTAAALWTGFDSALTFSVFLLAFSCLHVLLTKLKWMPSAQKNGREQIAYAPSIAAALIAVFMFGYLAPLTYTAVGPM
jgi:Flp pilus assembly protein protease CpaA